ncbi:DUF5631 domain-containing protein [Candidatus Mycobacterium methanotrophicum]|uniref:DUF5631 domain-containing protein n=2 Tax=Candidatus Mycobacterium methanotrophicum TaxID=2943498 RepID=UPI00351511E0
MTGGLWPAELSTVTAETAPLVKSLKADLQKIVNAANEELLSIRRAGLADATRQAEEARVINSARAFAVRRVESTVRHLRNMTPKSPAERPPVNGVDDTEKTQRFKVAAAAPTRTDAPAPPRPQYAEQDHRVTAQPPPAADLESGGPVRPVARHRAESDDTEVLDEIATLLQEITPLAEPPIAEAPRQPAAPRHAEPAVGPADEPVTAQQPAPQVESEPPVERLERLLKFVARQEPGLRWAVGNRADGTTLLVTDLAHGWIPPGIALPADVRLLEPQRRTGNAAALLSDTTLSATYAPTDPLGRATDYAPTDTSSQPRELPAIDDLGWLLSEATHWRDGLPRLVHTLAKAGAGGTGVLDAELDVLRVHLDTSRYQLFAQYPDIDSGLLLNCLLLAAAEAIAAGNLVNANYHFAWFQMLSTPPASGWKACP